eukprot:6463867-Amphidinium_carterae.1
MEEAPGAKSKAMPRPSGVPAVSWTAQKWKQDGTWNARAGEKWKEDVTPQAPAMKEYGWKGKTQEDGWKKKEEDNGWKKKGRRGQRRATYQDEKWVKYQQRQERQSMTSGATQQGVSSGWHPTGANAVPLGPTS